MKVDYLDLPEEENPFLGVRGIRLSLDKKELFETQLSSSVSSIQSQIYRVFDSIQSSIERNKLEIQRQTQTQLETLKADL